MCGRFTLGEIKELMTRFSIEHPLADMPKPRYNIAPSQAVPVVISRSPRALVMMQWGLVPFWAKDPSIGSRMINARSETVASRPAYRASVKSRRCLVPTTGFYEWKDSDKGKIPYLVKKKDEKLFAMAGLYDHWMGADGSELLSFTILTTDSNEMMRPIHDRMPVVLHRDDEELWVKSEPLPEGELERIRDPYPSEEMEAYPVSRAVNDASKDSSDLIKPVATVRSGKQWF